MAHFTPQSLSTKNDTSFIAFPGDSTQSSTTDHRMAYMQSLVIELSNPDLRENALYVLSKVLTYLSLIFCSFLMSFMGFTSNTNLGGVVILLYCDLNCLCAPLPTMNPFARPNNIFELSVVIFFIIELKGFNFFLCVYASLLRGNET